MAHAPHDWIPEVLDPTLEVTVFRVVLSLPTWPLRSHKSLFDPALEISVARTERTSRAVAEIDVTP
jgi:hypothetical protein